MIHKLDKGTFCPFLQVIGKVLIGQVPGQVSDNLHS